MSRVEISFPETFHFSTQLAVRVGDINYGNHLGHDRMITMMHEARILFFLSLGYSEFDIEGVGSLIGDLAISYRNEAFYGDLLAFRISVQELSKKSCHFYYHIARVDKNGSSSELIAIAKTGIVFFDYALRKSAEIPAAFIDKLARQADHSGS